MISRSCVVPVFGLALTLTPHFAASEGDQTEEQKADADYEKLVYLERALEKTGAGSKAVEDLRRESHGARSSMDSERSGENRSSPGRERSSSSRRSESRADGQRGTEHRRYRQEEDDEVVIGLGDHVPSFLLRPVRIKASSDT